MRNGVVADYDPYTVQRITNESISNMQLQQLGEMCSKYGLSCSYDMHHGFNIGEYESDIRITGRAEDAYAMIAASVNYENNFRDLASDRGPSKADQLENELEDTRNKHNQIIEEITNRFKEESDTDLFYSQIWDKALDIVKEILKDNYGDKVRSGYSD